MILGVSKYRSDTEIVLEDWYSDFLTKHLGVSVEIKDILILNDPDIWSDVDLTLIASIEPIDNISIEGMINSGWHRGNLPSRMAISSREYTDFLSQKTILGKSIREVIEWHDSIWIYIDKSEEVKNTRMKVPYWWLCVIIPDAGILYFREICH